MPVISFLSSLFQRHLTSRQLTHLSHPIIRHHSHSHTVAQSLPSKFYRKAGSYSLVPPSRGPMTCLLFADFVSSRTISPRPSAALNGKARRSKSPSLQRMSWRENNCDRQRTFTLREPKGRRCMVMLSSRRDGKRAIQRSGPCYYSFTEVRRCSRV